MAGKNDCFKTVTIHINDDKIKEIIKKTVKEVIANRAARTTIFLDNHDYTWRPAQWWYDRAETQRYTMAPSTATLSYDSNTNTITVNANFPVTKRP